jgi:hypothetical protein
MDIVFPCCAGLDVHKDTIVVCVRCLRSGAKRKSVNQIRTFGTTTEQILALADWLAEEGVTHVAMESTGVWKADRTNCCWSMHSTLSRFPVARRMSRIVNGLPNCCSAGCCVGALCHPRPSASCGN